MLPCNPGGHAAYHDTFISDFLIFYPDPFVLPKSTWDYMEHLPYLHAAEYSCAMKSHFRKSGNQVSGKWKSSCASLLA